MTTTREDVLACLRNIRDEIEAAAATLNGPHWSRSPANGWSAHQILAHMASTIGNAKFILTMARAGGGNAPQPADWGNPLWNEDEVAIRAENTVEELLDEIRAGLDCDESEVAGVPNRLLAMNFEAPWGPKGTVADVIIASANGHLGAHIDELRQAATQ